MKKVIIFSILGIIILAFLFVIIGYWMDSNKSLPEPSLFRKGNITILRKEFVDNKGKEIKIEDPGNPLKGFSIKVNSGTLSGHDLLLGYDDGSFEPSKGLDSKYMGKNIFLEIVGYENSNLDNPVEISFNSGQGYLFGYAVEDDETLNPIIGGLEKTSNINKWFTVRPKTTIIWLEDIDEREKF